LLILIFAILNLFVGSNQQFRDNFKFQNKDTLTFDDLVFDKESNIYKLYDLDLESRNALTNKFVNNLLVRQSLYGAHYYTNQTENEKFRLFSLFITQDDSDLLYLITTNYKNKLIDYYEIGEQKSLENVKSIMYSTEFTAKAIKINDYKYKILKLKWNESLNQNVSKDTLNTKIQTIYIEVDSLGKFKKR